MNNITLTFDQRQLEILNEALVRLPYATVAPLIAEINRQLGELNSKASNLTNPT
jgi:hypothetical protein